ncbi:MAG: hypothetical protein LKF71_01260 [Oscillospiraceae bacterium]|jgi:hypothetical protein|nr:hypothetical protein [Oscillospiraceae bacterium]
MIQQAAGLATLVPFDKDAFGCSMISTAQAYGMSTAAAQFWVGNGFAVRRQDSTVTLCGEVPQASAEELREFLSCIGMRTLVCSQQNSHILSLPTAETGAEMELAGQISAPPEKLHFASAVPAEDDLRLREMYEVLSACAAPDFQVTPFEPFYLDMSHRIRHRAVVCAGAYRQGKLCACASAALSPARMLLFGGAALPQVRGTGAFAAVLAGLVQKAAQNRAVSLLCGEYLRQHYQTFGFIEKHTAGI